MNGVEGWIIGTALLWIVTYICVNPVARHIATHRLRKRRVSSHESKIDPQSIPDRYFMFSGALIFTILGFLVGLLFGTYFIGLSWKKRHLPGVVALILASFAGFLFYACMHAQVYSLALLLLIITALTPVLTGAAVMVQTPQMLRWEGEAQVAQPKVQPRACPSCGNVNRLADKFCRRCGAHLPTIPTEEKAHCTKCGTELKKGAKFCHTCGQAVTS